MIDKTLRWDYKTWRRMGIDTRTGRPVKARRLKSAYRGDQHTKWLVHGLLLKPGDVIQTCRDYFNHRIDKIYDIERWNGHRKQDRYRKDTTYSQNESYFRDICFQCNDGYVHWWGSCCGLPKTVEEIESYHKNYYSSVINQPFEKSYAYQWFNEEESFGKYLEEQSRAHFVLTRLEKGLPICDEWGIEIKFKENE